MTDFYGKSYRYKDKVIGVIPTLNDELFVIGYIEPSGSLKRVKILALFPKADEAQKFLDGFAISRGLEVCNAKPDWDDWTQVVRYLDGVPPFDEP